MGGFTGMIELRNASVCEVVKKALASLSFKVQFGIWISLVTESDSDGLTLKPFLCEFWRSVGGGLDFSFTVMVPEDD